MLLLLREQCFVDFCQSEPTPCELDTAPASRMQRSVERVENSNKYYWPWTGCRRWWCSSCGADIELETGEHRIGSDVTSAPGNTSHSCSVIIELLLGQLSTEGENIAAIVGSWGWVRSDGIPRDRIVIHIQYGRKDINSDSPFGFWPPRSLRFWCGGDVARLRSCWSNMQDAEQAWLMCSQKPDRNQATAYQFLACSWKILARA